MRDKGNEGMDGHVHRCDACGEYIDEHLPSIECPREVTEGDFRTMTEDEQDEFLKEDG